MKVAVVDDSADIRDLVRRWSNRYGYEVVGEAVDGAAAVALAARERPDVLVLDVRMSATDGLDAIPAIRRASPGTRIVMFSAYEEHRGPALSLGADAWVTKSADFGRLLQAMRGASDT